MFFWCNNNNGLHAHIILHAHTPSSRRRHLPYNNTHHQRHSPSNVHRVVTLPEGRMKTRRGGGEMSRRNARMDHRNKSASSSSACFRSVATKAHLPHLPVSEARKGRGEGWRVGSRLADPVAARREEGEAQCGEDVLRGAHAEKCTGESESQEGSSLSRRA